MQHMVQLIIGIELLEFYIIIILNYYSCRSFISSICIHIFAAFVNLYYVTNDDCNTSTINKQANINNLLTSKRTCLLFINGIEYNKKESKKIRSIKEAKRIRKVKL